jgi:plastocyanin
MGRTARAAFATALTWAVFVSGAQLTQAAVVVKGVASSTSPTGFAFKPARLEVNPGTKVTWKAQTGRHTVSAISRNWRKDSEFRPGSPTSFTFKDAGTYRYRCIFHSIYNATTNKCTGMCGKVIVG